MIADIEQINDFLPCFTPQVWIDCALDNLGILLIDHAHCEKKAASSAMAMIYRYPNHPEMLLRMSKLVREELRHFEQVLKIMQKREITYTHLSPSRYAAGLHALADNKEPQRLIDSLIIGAFIEARSCERFAAIAPLLDDELCSFYHGLLASEARHFQVYLKLAQSFSELSIDKRVAMFKEKEGELIRGPDTEFRFHSGVRT